MILPLALAALAAAPAAAAAPPANGGDEALLRELRPSVDAVAALLRDAHAAEVSRTIRLVRRKDAWSDVVTAIVFLSFEGHEGSNTGVQYLAAFVRPQEVPEDLPVRFALLGVLPIGGSGERFLDLESARISTNGHWAEVELRGHRPGPDDRYHEMSVPTRARFRIFTHGGGKVAEVAAASARPRRASSAATSPASP